MNKLLSSKTKSINSNKIIYKIAKTDQDMRDVLAVREVLITDLGYKRELIAIENPKNNKHILAYVDQVPVGVITVTFPDENNQIAIQGYYDLSKFRSDYDAELKRLCVINGKRNNIGFALMILGYLYAKKHGAKILFLTTPVTNFHVNIYKKLNAIRIDKLKWDGMFNIYIMMINIASAIEDYKMPGGRLYAQKLTEILLLMEKEFDN